MHIHEQRRSIDAFVVCEWDAGRVYRFGMHAVSPLTPPLYWHIIDREQSLYIELLDGEGKYFVPTA